MVEPKFMAWVTSRRVRELEARVAQLEAVVASMRAARAAERPKKVRGVCSGCGYKVYTDRCP